MKSEHRRAISEALKLSWSKAHPETRRNRSKNRLKLLRTPEMRKRIGDKLRSYWEQMTPEERAREVERRHPKRRES